MPELFQQFSGMADMARAQTNNSNERTMYTQDEVRAVAADTESNWMDSVGLDLLGVTQQESVQTTAAADHQAAQANAWNQCGLDGMGTLQTCKGIVSAL